MRRRGLIRPPPGILGRGGDMEVKYSAAFMCLAVLCKEVVNVSIATWIYS